ncbi:sigma-70 family RNA polymerase sigma factor [Streptomyces sp. T-3]|nr:sigma-70 family RNA polymerase sigma factor [Streptomyces sp. T-3]
MVGKQTEDQQWEWEERPDHELVDKALHAETPTERSSAFGAVFARHHRRVLAYCSGRLQDPHAAADAAAQTFTDAFTDLDTLKDPAKLPEWLIGIARNRCRKEWERLGRQAPLPTEDTADDEADSYEKASRARQVEVDRLLDTVVETFTSKQQQLFRCTVRQGLVGAKLGATLSIKPEEASRRTAEIITLAYNGFGALVLAREGRRHCPGLARILDQAAWHGDNFTPKLRRRILRHLDTCRRCDNCSTCNKQRDRLIKPLAPALIPVLVTPVVQDRVYADIKERTRTQLNRILSAIGSLLSGILAMAVAGGLMVGALAGYQYLKDQAGKAPLVPAAPASTTTLDVWVADDRATVTSSPAGLNCNGVCHQPFPTGTRLTLTATVVTGSIPLNWVGCDTATSGAGEPCTVTLNQNTAVCLAPFGPLQPNLVTIDECRSRAA